MKNQVLTTSGWLNIVSMTDHLIYELVSQVYALTVGILYRIVGLYAQFEIVYAVWYTYIFAFDV